SAAPARTSALRDFIVAERIDAANLHQSCDVGPAAHKQIRASPHSGVSRSGSRPEGGAEAIAVRSRSPSAAGRHHRRRGATESGGAAHASARLVHPAGARARKLATDSGALEPPDGAGTRRLTGTARHPAP